VSTSKYTIDQLPELPVDALGLQANLEHALTEPVLTFRPNQVAVPEAPSPTAAAGLKSQHAVRKFLAQATYPKVTCYPFNELLDVTVRNVLEKPQRPLRDNESDLAARAGHKQFYKLTSAQHLKPTGPYFCTVEYGPWSALAVQEESCFTGVPTLWTFGIVSMPQVTLVWFGTWHDIPTHLYPSLHVLPDSLQLLSAQLLCCPGFKKCAGTCVPLNVNC
jgi:hypothetical protein